MEFIKQFKKWLSEKNIKMLIWLCGSLSANCFFIIFYFVTKPHHKTICFKFTVNCNNICCFLELLNLMKALASDQKNLDQNLKYTLVIPLFFLKCLKTSAKNCFPPFRGSLDNLIFILSMYIISHKEDFVV